MFVHDASRRQHVSGSLRFQPGEHRARHALGRKVPAPEFWAFLAFSVHRYSTPTPRGSPRRQLRRGQYVEAQAREPRRRQLALRAQVLVGVVSAKSRA